MSYHYILFRLLNEISTNIRHVQKITLCRSPRTKIPTNGVRDTDNSVINREIHYDVLFTHT